ncbi:3-hydroxyisobutyrate dehydrogenase [Irpex rosettiformis]|uniref:3-hydroxyisobutyrate dehydrogenase n=1 Tax=Irpex rosettiformis TaxID=378272 RepID=A0ACB8UIM7_9APHY|nr:3-hydroxyisobutyrate dehydrogenase [Irpex rosettiformis]
MGPTARFLASVSRSYSTHSPNVSSRHHTTAFIGLGRMGYEMAFNLFSRTLVESGGSAHFVVCDAKEESAALFVNNFHHHFPGARVEVASSPSDAVVASETIVTMLPSSPHVQKVYATEAGGILPALRSLSQGDIASTLCIDSTTLDVEVARDVAKEVNKTGAMMVDAPVSGGVAGAKAGTLSFLVGGTKPAFERVSPILSRIGKRIMYCGPSGAGLAAKICNNMVLGVQQIAIAEAMLLGQKLGLEPVVLADVINHSTGACWSSSVNNPVPGALPDKEPPCTRDFEGGFATSLMLKDMGLATEVGDLVGCPLPMGEAAERMYKEVIEAEPELANKDFSSVYKYLRLTADEESRKGRPGQSERI